MKIIFFGSEIDPKSITKVYPVANIQYDNEITEISLQWLDQNSSKVTILSYDLVIYMQSKRIKINFLTFEHLISAMEELNDLLFKLNTH